MISTSEIIIRLVVAAALGSVVGLERERLEWVAGLRTHMLVCVGSALVMIVSAFGFSGILDGPDIRFDPSRVAAHVVSGIGFLGAGTILVLRDRVIRGLTTAAGLWTTAAIGLAVGGGLYVAAGFTTGIALLILAGIKPLEKRFLSKPKINQLIIRFNTRQTGFAPIENTLRQSGLRVREIRMHSEAGENTDEIEVEFDKTVRREQIVQAADKLRMLPGVREIDFLETAST